MTKLQDRFILWLMNEFYETLQEDLNRYGKRVSKALTENKDTDVDLYLRMITETRGIIKDMSDENMGPKEFIQLIAKTYGLMKDE